MPRKGSKAPSNDEGPADLSSVTIELCRDEKDAQNVAYHASLLEAWKIVEGHPLFEGIGDKEPLSIAWGGALAPFNHELAMELHETLVQFLW